MDTPQPPFHAQPGPAGMRASDADRERVAALLQEHYAVGRLTFDEFQQRLELAYGSRTVGDLQRLTEDLPVEAAREVPRTETVQRQRPSQLRQAILSFIVVSVFLTALWAATGAHGSFWPIYPILVWGFILASRAVGLHSGRPGRDEARARRRAAREARRRARRGLPPDQPD